MSSCSTPLLQKAHLCIAIPHVERSENYLLQTVRSLVGGVSSRNTVIAICDFSAEPSANLKLVAEEFAPLVDAGHLVIERHGRRQTRVDGLVRNFGDDEERVRWRSRQVLDTAHMMERYCSLAPHYLHLEDDVVASEGYLVAASQIIDAAPANWFSIKLSPLGACAVMLKSTDLMQLSAYLRLLYYEMPLDWLVDGYIEFKGRTGRTSFIESGLFEHIGVYSSFPGQIR